MFFCAVLFWGVLYNAWDSALFGGNCPISVWCTLWAAAQWASGILAPRAPVATLGFKWKSQLHVQGAHLWAYITITKCFKKKTMQDKSCDFYMNFLIWFVWSMVVLSDLLASIMTISYRLNLKNIRFLVFFSLGFSICVWVVKSFSERLLLI